MLKGLFALVFSALLIFGSVYLAVAGKESPTSEKGRVIYEAFCMVCHGPEGRGDGPSADTLIPMPADFTNTVVVESMTKDRVYEAIRDGKAGTQMEGFSKRLSLDEIQQVMEYVLVTIMGK